MRRAQIERWLARHPESIHAAPDALLDRCEAGVRAHARELAWSEARSQAEASLHHFDRGFGLPASESFVTREVCHEVARELRRHEPRLGEVDPSEWIDGSDLDALDDDARAVFRSWIGDLAAKEEHAAWKEIVSFTHRLARAIVLNAEMTDSLDWDFEKSYPRLAEHVSALVLREFDRHLPSSRIRNPHDPIAG